MSSRTALITGLRGQDGSLLAAFLLDKGYRVVGTSHCGEGEHVLPDYGREVELLRQGQCYSV